MKFGAEVKLHMALVSDRCQSLAWRARLGNDHLSKNQHDFKGAVENQLIVLGDKTRFFDIRV